MIIKINPKFVFNIIIFIFGTVVYYGVTLFVLLFLLSNFNDSFKNIYVSALPLALVSEVPLIGYKIQSKYNEEGIFSTLEFAMPFLKSQILLIAATYILTIATLFILTFTTNDNFQNILLSAIPLTVVSAIFLLSYKFWDFIKESA